MRISDHKSLIGPANIGLVAPAGEVGVGWGGFGDAVHDLGKVHLVVVEAGVGVGFGGVTVPAVLGAGAVFDFAVVGDAVAGGAGGLEEVFHQVDGVVEETGVVGAGVEAELAPGR